MKYMLMRKADADTENGVMPSEAILNAMADYNERMTQAGVFTGGDGLWPTREGCRIQFRNGEPAVINGPFEQTSELLAGYSVLEVDSIEDAIAWAKQWPREDGGGNATLELRRYFTLEDFEPSPALEKHRALHKLPREMNVHGRHTMTGRPKNTICLWYNGDAEEAARFYAETFPDSSVDSVNRAPGDYPSGSEGDVLTVEFTVLGIPCLGLNGGPAFKHSEAFSFQVATYDQEETDRYWNAIVGNGGEESDCGWCRDKWGLSWQITPAVLMEAITDPDPAAAKRAFDAMMTMGKIDIAAIEAARRG